MSAQYRINFNKHGEGWVVNEEAGENLPIHNLVYRNAAGTWSLADADTVATMPVLGITMGTISTGKKGEILLWGYIGDTAWTWTQGAEIYVSTTPGVLTETMPTGAGDVVQVVAISMHDGTMIHFMGTAGAAIGGSNTLEGETAFVGFDNSKSHFVNYFVCDGIADEVQINAAIAYVSGLEGGTVYLERGDYDIAAVVQLLEQVNIIGAGYDAVTLTTSFTGANAFVGDLTAQWDDVLLQGFHLQGNANIDVGLNLSNGYRIVTKELFINGFTKTGAYGILVSGANGNRSAQGKHYNDVLAGCDTIIGIIRNAAEFNSNHLFKGCYISNPTTWSAIIDHARIVTFEECVFEALPEDGGGIQLNAAAYNTGIIQCYFEQDGGDNTISIDINTDAKGTYVRNCHTSGVTGAGSFFITDDGEQNVVNMSTFNNQDYWKDNYIAMDAPPSVPALGDIYLDDGTNTGSGDPMLRYYDGANWRWLTSIQDMWFGVKDPDATLGYHPAVTLIDGASTTVYNQILIPHDFGSLISAEIVIVGAGTGDMRYRIRTNWGEIGVDDYNTNSDSYGFQNLAITAANKLYGLDKLEDALTGVSPGDLVGVEFLRLGGSVDDTVNADCYYLGIRVRYSL